MTILRILLHAATLLSDQHCPHLNVCWNCLGILSKCKFWSSTSGEGLPGDTWAARLWVIHGPVVLVELCPPQIHVLESIVNGTLLGNSVGTDVIS